MAETIKTTRSVWRRLPCPLYDVECLEGWLTKLAAEGLLLTKDGVWGGFAVFERGEACTARYRLAAAEKSADLWAEDGGAPAPEQVELSAHYQWEYVARCGEFYVYRTFDPGTRELNTDSAVQALALGSVKKRMLAACMPLAVACGVYAILFIRGGPVLTLLEVGTVFSVLAAAFVLWSLGDSLAAFFSLRRLQKQLHAGSFKDTAPHTDSRRTARRYHAKKYAQLALCIAMLCLFVQRKSAQSTGAGRLSPGDYTGSPPFATIRDLAGPDAENYHAAEYGREFDFIREWSDPLSPRCIEYVEHAGATLPGGQTLQGGLYVDYNEAATVFLARQLAKDYHTADTFRAEHGALCMLDAAALGVDSAVSYSGILGAPTVVLQKGRTVIHASFLWSGANESEVTAEQLAQCLSEGMQRRTDES